MHGFSETERVTEGNELHVRTLHPFEHAVLLSVSHLGPMAFPAEITRRLTDVLQRRVSLAQVFITLERMEDKGMVSSQDTRPEPVRGGRRRRVFRLEASGKHALSQMAATYRRMSSQPDRLETSDEKEQAIASTS